MELYLRQRKFDPADRPLVMGILNVTPDSFSDGGKYVEPADAMAHAQAMVSEGADIIDVGPESTRPGARDVSADEQIGRAVPIIRAIRAADSEIPISIDTRLAPVAEAALDAGADIINDVSALRDDAAMVDLAATAKVPIIMMHRKGTPATMQDRGGPDYDDVVAEICVFLRERVRFATDHGVDPARIIIDPGVGFGKRVEHNLLILRHLPRFVALGHPLLLGASRKSFIGCVLGGQADAIGPIPLSDPIRQSGPAAPSSQPRHHGQDSGEREAASLACAAMAVMAGVSIIRTHEVRATSDVVSLCTAVRRAGGAVPADR